MPPIITKRKSRQTSAQTQKPRVDKPALLHEFLEQAARRWPERIAVDTPPASTRLERRTITYSDLDRHANALGLFLRGFVKEECVVAILLPRDSEHLYLAQVAVLKAGAAYTCIDPAFPDEQVVNILSDSHAVAILTDAAGRKRTQRVNPGLECALDVVDWIDRFHGPVEPLEPASWLSPNSLAYIIYTSGTTGRPKGVMIEHGSIANLVQGDLQQLGVGPTDRVGQSASPAYDSSVEETWFALSAGATLVVMDDETTRLGPDLIGWLRRERITMFAPSPTLLRATGCDNPEKELPNLRLVHVGGEALPIDVAERWSRGRCLVNDYGPTETTVTALRGRILPGKPITIGRPVPGMKAWVLNGKLEEVADGEQGELCLGGVALARGYMNDPATTAKKFPVHPLFGRIYRTGDLVHRDRNGKFYCHGRIDAQVKIRGYRIELESIEARLIECAGVREAACGVQGEDAQQRLVAFFVPEDSDSPPSFEDLKYALRKVLPVYMVPARFGILNELPTTVSGKLNRRGLPVLEGHGNDLSCQALAPRNPVEEKLVSGFRIVLEANEDISVEQDFFNDLGGDSLSAAGLISRLRVDPVTASLTVRDLYEARTVVELAKRVGTDTNCHPVPPTSDRFGTCPTGGHPVLATMVQSLWLILGLTLAAPLAYLAAFRAVPFLLENLGLVPFLLVTPVLYFGGVLTYSVLTISLALLAKKILIGHYRSLRAPVWGSFYVRNWMVQQVVSLVPWRLFEGTMFQHMILRALGARIGKRVHIHRGVNLLQGGWDLLDIGDNVTLSQDASLRLVELEDRQIVVGPITLETGSTLDVRAGVAGTTHLETDAYLTALSFLPRGNRIPRGQRWEGVPAKPAGMTLTNGACRTAEASDLSPAKHGMALIICRFALGIFLGLPVVAPALVFALFFGLNDENTVAWIAHPTLNVWAVIGAIGLATLAVPGSLLFQVIAMRAMGRVQPGAISRWSPAYIRIWLKADILHSATRWLSGTLLWPVWLRCCGMKIGRGCEISTIIDTVPELVEIGDETFFADGVYLGGPQIHQGTVNLAQVRLGKNTFLGNHAVVCAGQSLRDDVLLGICTVADDKQILPGTSWFGHPPFELPNREVVQCDRQFTHTPIWPLYLGRVFWEMLRFALPLVPVLLVLGWFMSLAAAETVVSLPVLMVVIVPLLDFAVLAFLCLLVLALKWLLLGRVRPGQHPLWSGWCYRWDFLYVAWDVYGRRPLAALEGTLLLNGYLRAMGMRIGRQVVLGSGFSHVVDPDMLEFEDGVTVSCLFQAHTFEDRVLKIDYVMIRRDATVGNVAVLLYGADIGERTTVMPQSVVMKRERLLANHSYAGCPTRLLS